MNTPKTGFHGGGEAVAIFDIPDTNATFSIVGSINFVGLLKK